jgi:osmotically-inducible protein OsmY
MAAAQTFRAITCSRSRPVAFGDDDANVFDRRRYVMQTRLHHGLLIAGLAIVLVAGAAPARAGMSDAWVSTKVKMLLINSPSVGGFPISVDTDEGRVTLHGKVPTNAEKTEAGRIASAGTGVVSVRNLLQVVPDSQRKSVDVTDDRLKDDVDAALKAEPALAKSSIETKSVNKGVVLLEGKASTLSAHLLALEVASAVPGVRQVASEIESPNEFGDREVWFDAPPVDSLQGNVMTDAWITAQTKMIFMTDADIPAGDINVDTRRGVVTLFGSVPTSAIGDKAVRVTNDVAGVKSVNRELRVVAASDKKHAVAKDSQLTSSVRQRIADAKMEGSDIHVEVKAGTVRLTGTVQHASQRYAAVSIAHATTGVARVQNDLRIENATASQM